MSDAADPKKGGGKGKPPPAYQFQKGKSGNPKGRPKGAKNLKTIVNRIGNQRVKLVINGKTTWMSKAEALVEMISMRAIQGKGASEANMLALLREHLPLPDEERTAGLSPDKLAVLNNHLKFEKLVDEVAAATVPPPPKGKNP